MTNNGGDPSVTPIPSKLLVRPKEFSGEKNEDVAQWLRTFERNANISGLGDSVKASIAIGLLQGQAELWFTAQVRKKVLEEPPE